MRPNKIRRLAAAAALGAAAAAIWVAPEAKADDVQTYLEVLEERGIYAKSGEGTLVMAGQMVCNGIENGYTPMQMAEKVYYATDSSITAGDAGYIVGAAVAGLCPEYLYLMEGN